MIVQALKKLDKSGIHIPGGNIDSSFMNLIKKFHGQNGFQDRDAYILKDAKLFKALELDRALLTIELMLKKAIDDHRIQSNCTQSLEGLINDARQFGISPRVLVGPS